MPKIYYNLFTGLFLIFTIGCSRLGGDVIPALQLTGHATATILTYTSNMKGTMQGTFNGDKLDGLFNNHHVKESFYLKQ